MARCIFENLTPEQAEMLSSWYCNQGEQNIEEWADINEIPVPYWKSDMKVGDDVIVQCKTEE